MEMYMVISHEPLSIARCSNFFFNGFNGTSTMGFRSVRIEEKLRQKDDTE
jgi:hypothetical protein